LPICAKEGLGERVDLGARRLHFGLADLREETRADEAGQQADDDHHHEKLQQREATD